MEVIRATSCCSCCGSRPSLPPGHDFHNPHHPRSTRDDARERTYPREALLGIGRQNLIQHELPPRLHLFLLFELVVVRDE